MCLNFRFRPSDSFDQRILVPAYFARVVVGKADEAGCTIGPCILPFIVEKTGQLRDNLLRTSVGLLDDATAALLSCAGQDIRSLCSYVSVTTVQ